MDNAAIFEKYGLSSTGTRRAASSPAAVQNKTGGAASTEEILAKYGVSKPSAPQGSGYVSVAKLNRETNGSGVKPSAQTRTDSGGASSVVPVSRAIEESNARIRYNRAKADVEADKHSVGDIYSNDFAAREAERERREQNEKRLAEAAETMKRLGYAEEVDPTLGERVVKTLTGSAKLYGAQGVGVAESAANVEQAYRAANPSSYARDVERTWVQPTPESTAAQAEQLQQLGSRLKQSGSEDVERAQQGLGTLGRLGVQATVAATQMGADVALGALTGGGSMLPMVVRSFGGGVQEAREKGYSAKQQVALGLANAATEWFTEKLFGGNPAYDTDVGLVNKLVAKVTKNERLVSALSSLPADIISEGLEEIIADVLEPISEKVVTGNWTGYDIDRIIEDGVVGMLLGGVGQGGNVVVNAVRGTNAQSALQTSSVDAGQMTTISEGNLTPAANSPAEAQKTASGEAGQYGGIPMGDKAVVIDEFQRRERHSDMLDEIRGHLPELQGKTAVARLSGNEFQVSATDNRTLQQKVSNFFNSFGNKVRHKDLGEITLNDAGVHDSIGHGMGKLKAATFAALPSILSSGDIIKMRGPYEGHDYDSVYIAAPVKIGEETCYVGALVIRDEKMQRYKLHEVLVTNGDGTPLFQTESASTPKNTDGPLRNDVPPGNPNDSLYSDTTIPQPSNPVKPAELTAKPLPDPANSQTFGNLNEPGVRPLPTGAESGATVETQQGPDARERIPAKAQDYLHRAERALLNRLGDALSVPRMARRDYLQGIVQAMSEEYLRNGSISRESVNNLFEQAYAQGIVSDTEFYDAYKGLKDLLRNTSVSIREEDAADIGDFRDFRQRAFGTLRIANNGTPVDVVYEDLRAVAPELFPASITHPADQLQRMYEVGKSIQKVERDLNGYYGEQAEDFKAWARNDFEAAMQESVAELNRVKRYADEQAGKNAKPAITEATVKNAFDNVLRARRTADKVKARNLLTEYDNAQVGRLLKGEITLGDLDAGKANVKGIREVYEAQREYERYAETIRDYNKQRKANLLSEADNYLSTANDWKDKPNGFLYSRETMERNLRDIVPDRATANQIVDKYFTPVHEAEAESTRFKNEYRDRVRKLNLSRKIADGNTVSEAHAVQLLGEAEDNIRVLNESRRAGEQRDGKTAEEWQAVIRELWEQNPKLDRAKVENAVKAFRCIYDELFQRMNEVRVRNGYEPVAYRQGYFPHFQPGETEGVMAMFGKALGIDTNVQTLPTTINGLTHTFRPGITWFGNAQERLGFDTAYDAVEGFDKYIEGVSDVIHQTDNIQRLRALATQIRYRTGDEGIRKQMDAIRVNPNLNEEEKRAALDELYKDGRFTLGNFVVELEEYTNLLANKKSRMDRTMEQFLGRRMYTLMKGLESRVAANMVAVNPGSWLTNFIPLTQGWATLDTGTLLRGMGQTLKAYKSDDGMVARSAFLTNRRGSDPIVKTWAQDVSSKLSSPMEYIDQFTADSLVRARYMQNVRQGLSEDAAIKEADAWAAGIMADRSKGSMPTIFSHANPVTKLFSQFQLEVNNEFSNLFKDVPDELKKKGLGALAAGLLKYFVGAFLYNEIYEYAVGRRAAFDPIGLLNDSVGDLTGYELPNLIEGAQGMMNGEGADVFKTAKADTYDAISNLAGNAAEELPFVGGLLGGGRLPVSSAIPNFAKLVQAATDKDWDARKRRYTAGTELAKPLAYLALPFGGGQLKKIYQGLGAVADGGSYSVDSQGRDILQYPVFNDTPGEIAGGVAKSLLFGKSSLPAARDWVESGFDSFSAKETAVYQGMNEAGVSDRDAYELLRELGSAQKTDDESANEAKRRILRESEISGDGKSVAYYALLASDKERKLMDDLADSSDMGAVTEMLMQFKDNSDNEKCQLILNAQMSESEKRALYRTSVNDKNEEKLDKLGSQGVGIDYWLRYQTETAGLTADKDANGKTVSGSKKAKQMAVIDAMPLTVKQKDALYLAAGLSASTIDDAPWHEVAPLTLPAPGRSTQEYEKPRYFAAP